MRAARPRRRHRVPADRGHARRAEGPPPAARAATTSTSTRSCALWEERDLLLARLLECKTFKDVAARVRPLADDADRSSCPAASGPRSAFARPGARPARRASTPDAAARPPSCGATPEAGAARSTSIHVAPIRASVADAVAELLDELPRRRAASRFRRLTAGARRAARGDRALPRRARAVQAGRRRPRPGRHASATSRCAGCGDGRRPPLDAASLADRRATTADRRRRETVARARCRDDDPLDEATRGLRAHERAPGHRGGRAGRRPSRSSRACSPSSLELPVASVEAAVRASWPPSTTRPAAASRSCRWPAATGTRPIPTWRRTSSGSCSTASARGCRRRARDAGDRRLQAADLAGADRRRSAASTSTACCARCSARGYIDEVGRDPGPGPGGAVRHDAGVPRDSSASTRSPTCRRSASSCPAPTSSRRSSAACASTDGPPDARRRR